MLVIPSEVMVVILSAAKNLFLEAQGKTLLKLRVINAGHSIRSKGCHSERSEESFSGGAGQDPSQAQGGG